MPKRWSSRLAFLITAAGFAVGVGNIWRFPYITGENGGAAFLLVYLLLCFFLGIPLLTIELGLGRMSRKSPLSGFSVLSGKSKWDGIGWLAFLAGWLIHMFYVMIMAWILLYFWDALTGTLFKQSAADKSIYFQELTGDTGRVLLANAVILILAAFVISQDLRKGLEPVSRFLMSGLLLLLLILTIWCCTLEGARDGLTFYLTPDFSKINLSVFFSALGQLFFSLGVGMVAVFIFGSYTSDKESLTRSAGLVVLADALVAILAGLMIFPALFTYGLDPASGPDLIFVTMAAFFQDVGGGRFFAILFFLLLFIAGFTSLIGGMQGLKDSLVERYRWKGTPVLIGLMTTVMLGSIPMVMSYAPDPWQWFERSPFAVFDFLTNSIMLPVGGLLMALFAAYVVGFDRMAKAVVPTLAGWKNNFWRFVVCLIIPAAILIILWQAI